MCKNCNCQCRGLPLFQALTLTTMTIGLTEMIIGVIFHCIRFIKFVTDEWFSEFFAITCGFLVFSVAILGIYIMNQLRTRQKKFKAYAWVLLLPLFYQCLTALMISLPVFYRDPNLAIPAYVPGSQVHRLTKERYIYTTAIFVLNIVSWVNIIVLITHWYFTVCYANSEEVFEGEYVYNPYYLREKERGRFASTRSLRVSRRY